MAESKGAGDEFLKAAFWEDKPEAWHEVMKGVRRRVLTHSPVGMMVLYRIEPKSVFPLHSHPHAQFGVFLEGAGELRVGDSVWKMKKGDSYYIPPGMMHELRIDPAQQSVIIDFFTPERQDFHAETLPPEES